MLRFKMDVVSALKEKGITSHTIKSPFSPYYCLFGQGVFQKLRKQDISVNLAAIEKLCFVLECQPGDLIEFVPSESDECYVWRDES